MNSARAPERRQLTVMLCDLVGWTNLSVRLDAEELAEVVQDYRQRCASVIESHGGTVAQYAGDAVLAYFGYPRAYENAAERAVRAALAIVASPGAAAENAGSGVHIGIATGIVVVGDLGAEAGRSPSAARANASDEISAVGSAPNLAARLQGLARPGTVVVSEQTHRLAGGMFEYEDLGRHTLKGFDEPVRAWRVVAERPVRSRFHALRASALTPLVDRRTELQALRETWHAVRTGRGKAVLLSSEPGVGKSRLAEVTASQITDRHCLRLWYYCAPHLQSTPLAPLVQQLSSVARLTPNDDDDAKLEKLAALLPPEAKAPGEIVALLAHLLGIDYRQRYRRLSLSAQRLKHRLFEGLLQVLATLASRRPVMVVVEDLHWIDPSSSELLGLMIERLQTLPVLAVLTARPEFESDWGRSANLVRRVLPPLDHRDSVAMIEILCGDNAVPAETIDRIADQTDGVPLFIEDLTRDVLEAGALRHAGEGAVAPRESPIPATLNDSLMARLDRLGPAKKIAQIGATIGREFSPSLLAKVTRLPEAEVEAQLEQLVASGLLIAPRPGPHQTFKFKHALVRDAAYASLLRKDRAVLHLTIAERLSEEFPEIADSQPEVVALHFEAAKDADRAALYLVRAAELSAKRSGFVEAIAQLARALDLLAAQPESASRLRRELEVYLALGAINAEYRGFSAAACGDAYERALERCRRLGNPPEIFAVLSGVGAFEITRVNFARCRALAEECLALAASQTSRPPFVMGHRLLGGTLFLTGELAAARRHQEAALRYYEEEPSLYTGPGALHVQDHKSTALCYLALTLTLLGYVDRGLAAAEQSVSHSRSLGEPHTINFSLCYLAAVHHIRRDTGEALRRATESLELAREQGFATWIGISQMIVGESLVRRGDVQEGLREIASGMQAHTKMEASAYQPFGISLLARSLLGARRLDEALDAANKAVAIAERTGERFYLAELWRLKGEILAQAQRIAEAEAALEQAIEIAGRQDARLFGLRSAVTLCSLLDAPRRDRVIRDVLEPLCSWFAEDADTADLRDARTLLASR